MKPWLEALIWIIILPVILASATIIIVCVMTYEMSIDYVMRLFLILIFGIAAGSIPITKYFDSQKKVKGK